MQVLFDNIIFNAQKAGGISTVWIELIKRVLLNKEIKSYFLEYKSQINIDKANLNIPENLIMLLNNRFLRLKSYLKPKVNIKEKFIFHSSYYRVTGNKKAINVTTVHDFTYEYFSSGIRKIVHCWQKYRSIKNSEAIICISENTKKDLLKFLPKIDTKKIYVVYNGVSDDYYPLNNKPLDITYSNSSFALFVGSRSKYKNFDLAVKAVAASKLNLKITGKPLSENEKYFLNTVLGYERYEHLGYVEIQELNRLYNNAYVLIYPSSYEGFGIPVLEAQKAGCPVIAYNSSSIPEIIGDTPLLINELSVESIINCFEIISNKEKREEIVNKGFINARRFSWDNNYEKIMKIYKNIWEEKI